MSAWLTVLTMTVAAAAWPGRTAAQAPAAAAPSPSPRAELAPGEAVPSFQAEGLNGVTYTVDFPADTATVLLFFLSSCPVCHKMIPEWSRAFDKKPAKLKVVGIMLDHEAPGFFGSMPITFPVLRAIDRRAVGRTFKVYHVPMTLRVAPGGKVEAVATGLLDPPRLGAFFKP